jgi:hypothetical protein
MNQLPEYIESSRLIIRVAKPDDAALFNQAKFAVRAGFLLEGILHNERFNLQGQLRHTQIYARTPT